MKYLKNYNLIEYINQVKNINKNDLKYFYTQTFGCQQNENDTEKINGMLIQMGYKYTEDKNIADIIIFNTCAVREHAELRVFGSIGALKRYKEKKPSLIIGICGCMAQQEHIVKQLKEKYKTVNMIFGPQAINNFPKILLGTLTENKTIIDISENHEISEEIPIQRLSDHKAWVSIMSGCNNFCSYCVVPYVRGREKSRKPEIVLSEIKSLLDNGYKDITLLGQNVNSYNANNNSKYDFADLLKDINNLKGKFRIRFMSSHPKDLSIKLIDTIAECDKICKHIHLPFQSGSNRILELMNRRYTRENYLELIKYAKEKIPGVVFTSDIIVGFPTETDQDFEDTLDIIEKVGYDGLYTFIYSKRKNTPAYEMENHISKEIKNKRFQQLLDKQEQLATEMNKQYHGQIIEILCDGLSANGEYMTGRTDTNKIVNFDVNDIKAGEFANIKIEKELNWALFGKIVK